MASSNKTTRRDLLGNAGKTVVGAGFGLAFPMFLTGPMRGQDAPSERIRLGCIGVGGQGNSNMRGMMKNVVAVCDVDKTHLADAKAKVEKANGGTCATF